jgi:hypothetical protein
VEQAMKNFLTIILLSLVSVAVHGEEPGGKVAAAKEVLVASNAKAIFTEARKQIESMTDQALAKTIPADKKGMVERYKKRVQSILDEGLNWGAMEAQMLDIYQRTFSQKEMQDMATFYQSESGQAIMKKMPKVMAESVQISQRQMQHVMPSLRQMFSDMEAELAHTEVQKQ